MEKDGITRLSNFTCTDDYINCRRRVKDYNAQYDQELLGISKLAYPEIDSQRLRWNVLNAKNKSAATLTLSDAPLAQASKIVDDYEEKAHDLWI